MLMALSQLFTDAQQLVEQDKLKIVTKKVKSEFCERSEEKTVTPKEHKSKLTEWLTK